MEFAQIKVQKEYVDFLLSYVVIRRNASTSHYFQQPLKNLYQFVCDSIEELSYADKNLDDIEMKSDCPSVSGSFMHRRAPSLGNNIFRSSFISRFSPDVRSDGASLPNVSVKLPSVPGSSVTAVDTSILRAPKRINSVLAKSSPEMLPTETAPAMTRMLSLKDLRHIDFQLSNRDRAPSLMIRRHCMVVSFGLIRAILLADRVILLCPASSLADMDGQSYVTAFESFVKDWRNLDGAITPKQSRSSSRSTRFSYSSSNNSNNSSGSGSSSSRVISFEHHVLEGLLAIVKTCEEQEYEYLNSSLRAAFEHYHSSSSGKPSVETEMRFKNCKAALRDLRSRALAYRTCLNDLMVDEEQMALMNLSYLQKRPHLYRYPFAVEILRRHEIIEDLLESDLLDFTNILRNVYHLMNRVLNVEAMLNIIENMTLRGETCIMLLVCSVAFAAYIAGAFGMNLDNVDPSARTEFATFFGGFSIVFVVSFVSIALMFYSFLLSFLWSKVFPLLSPWTLKF